MKKIALLLIVLLATGTMLMAQGGPRRGERGNRNGNGVNIKEHAERMSAQMAKTYSLNDAQKRQVYEANLIMIADMQPARRVGQGFHRPSPGFGMGKRFEDQPRDTAQIAKRGEREKMMKEKMAKEKEVKAEQRDKWAENMKQSREAYETKIKGILTKDQYEAYTKDQAERQKRMEERRADKSWGAKKS